MCEDNLDLRDSKILVVDDNLQVLQVVAELLISRGYKIVDAMNGKDAIRLALRTSPQLILLDVNMPGGLNGFDTLKKLKAQSATKRVPVILTSHVYKDHPDVKLGLEFGAVDYITKPVDEGVLLARVETHLANYLLSQRAEREAERYRAVVNNLSEGVIITDFEGRIAEANPEAEKLFGWAPGRLVGELVDDFFSARETGEGFGNWCDALAAKARPVEMPLRLRNGDERIVDLAVNPMYVATREYVLMLRDIGSDSRINEDFLTGVLNRRGIEKKLAGLWGVNRKSGRELAVILIDVDHFKAYNDTYGHLKGDTILRIVAEVIQSNVASHANASCVVGRFGGEEFLAILPDMDQESAGETAEKIREAVESREIPNGKQGKGRVLTVSAGVAATRTDKAERYSDLVEMADQRLYRAKDKGRNCVCISGGGV